MKTLTREQFQELYGEETLGRFGRSSPDLSFFEDLKGDFSEMTQEFDATNQKYGTQYAQREIGQPGISDKTDLRMHKLGDIGGAFSDHLFSSIKGIGKMFLPEKAEQATGEAIQRGMGATVNAFDKAGDVAIGVGKAVLPESYTRKMSSGMDELADRLGLNDDLSKTQWENFQNKHPDAAEIIKTEGNFLKFFADVVGVGIAGKSTKVAGEIFDQGIDATKAATKQVATQAAAKADDVTRTVTNTARAGGGVVGDTAEFAVRQGTGLGADDVLTILRDPKKYEAAVKEGLDATSIANQIKKAVDDIRSTAADVGKTYAPIRKSGAEVTLPAGWLGSQIERFGYKVADGVVEATTKAKSRAAGDVNALQKLMDDWGGRTTIDADEFLNFRSDLAAAARYDKLGASKPVEAITKSIRSELNSGFRDQIKGLKGIDAKNTALRKELQAIDRLLFDKAGELRDVDISKIFNSTNRNRQQVIKVLKKVDPQIEEKIRLARTIRNVEDATGNKVGMYIRGGVGAGITVANPVVGLLALMAANPKIFVRFLLWTGKRYPGLAKTLERAATKAKKGQPLTKGETEAVNIAVQQSDETMEKFIRSDNEAMGVVGGIGMDEEGNLTFNPLGAAVGMGAMRATRGAGSNRFIQDKKTGKMMGSGRKATTLSDSVPITLAAEDVVQRLTGPQLKEIRDFVEEGIKTTTTGIPMLTSKQKAGLSKLRQMDIEYPTNVKDLKAWMREIVEEAERTGAYRQIPVESAKR